MDTFKFVAERVESAAAYLVVVLLLKINELIRFGEFCLGVKHYGS